MPNKPQIRYTIITMHHAMLLGTVDVPGTHLDRNSSLLTTVDTQMGAVNLRD
jgi:hypothetical protein